MDPEKSRFAQRTDARSLAQVIAGADVFLGLSAGGVLTQAMVRLMAAKPLILALANPTPEILPELVKAVRDDAVIATAAATIPTRSTMCCAFRSFPGCIGRWRHHHHPADGNRRRACHRGTRAAGAERCRLGGVRRHSDLAFGPNI